MTYVDLHHHGMTATKTSSSSLRSSSQNLTQRKRRQPGHHAWTAKPTSLMAKSISAPHRSSSSLSMERFGHTVIDVRAPTEWTITSLDVTIPVAREEDTSPTTTTAFGRGGRAGGRAGGRRPGGGVPPSIRDAPHGGGGRRRGDDATDPSVITFTDAPPHKSSTTSSNPTTTTSSPSSTSNSNSNSTSLMRSVGGRYTSYVIRVVAGHKTWHVAHRYSDFEMLHLHLKSILGRSMLPPFPPKYRLQFNNLDPSFVEKRRTQLEVYLGTIVRIDQVWSCQRYMVDFLDNNIETLGMQTKYERMMRVQGVLLRASQMNAKKNIMTERRLNESIHQVDLLKNEIQRLENKVLEQQREMEEKMQHNIEKEIAKQLSRHLQGFSMGNYENSSAVGAVGGAVGAVGAVGGRDTSSDMSRNTKQHSPSSHSDSHVTTPLQVEDDDTVDCIDACNELTVLSHETVQHVSSILLQRVLPTVASDTKRQRVIRFVAHIVKSCLGSDVYLTGSYPTKTCVVVVSVSVVSVVVDFI